MSLSRVSSCTLRSREIYSSTESSLSAEQGPMTSTKRSSRPVKMSLRILSLSFFLAAISAVMG